MATITQTLNQKPMRICFSFAAYAKNLIDHLKSCNIPVLDGLSDSEFSSIESSLGFNFPPDLRSILREGIPIGSGFPNWRSSSLQQLEILTSLPILGICKEVSRRNFWCESWGERPTDPNEAIAVAKRFLKKAPVLVPIYKSFYIPSSPNLAGNPVFFIQGCDFKLSSFDVSGFFQNVELWPASAKLSSPIWAATSPREVEFWSDMVEWASEIRMKKREWWAIGELGGCLEELSSTLRDGGWKEEEVREMMMMDGGGGGGGGDDWRKKTNEGKIEMLHVRVLSRRLLRGGWSREDVTYSLGNYNYQVENGFPKEESLLDFQIFKAEMSC